MVTGEAGTRLTGTWTETDGRPATLDVTVADPPGHESLNVVIPWSETRFQFTSKHQARPATGTLTVGDRKYRLGDNDAAWGVLDVGRGRWPYRTRWNWGGGAGPAGDGRTIGLQIGGKWTDGTGFTENGVLIDGRLTKIGDELAWDYDWDRPLEPWRVRSSDGAMDLTLVPVHDRHETHQRRRPAHRGAPGLRSLGGHGPGRCGRHRGRRRPPGLRRGVPLPLVSLRGCPRGR